MHALKSDVITGLKQEFTNSVDLRDNERYGFII